MHISLAFCQSVNIISKQTRIILIADTFSFSHEFKMMRFPAMGTGLDDLHQKVRTHGTVQRRHQLANDVLNSPRQASTDPNCLILFFQLFL